MIYFGYFFEIKYIKIIIFYLIKFYKNYKKLLKYYKILQNLIMKNQEISIGYPKDIIWFFHGNEGRNEWKNKRVIR